MSKRKRNVKSPLGHDPFESMTDFEIEGPAPEAQQEVKRPAPKPQIRRAFKKVETNGEKPKAFAIADFFTTLVKPQPETEPADEDDTAVAEIAEEIEEEVEAASFLADEGAAVAEPTVAEDEDEDQGLDEEVFELDTAVWESTDTNEAEDSATDDDEFVFDITRVTFPEPLEEEMLEEEDEPDQTAAALPETALLSDDTDETDETDETDDDEAEATEPLSISDELPETAVLTTDTDAEENEEPEEEAPLLDTAVLADEETAEPQTELLDEPLPETAAWAFDDAGVDDTILALDEPAVEADELVDEDEEEDDIFPTAAELRGILDTAELALSVEHQMALSHDDEDEEEEVWGATSPLDPDLDFEWADEAEDEEDTELPNWLTDSTSAEKFDTDSLNPLLQEDEPPTAEPDLDFSWEEEDAEDDGSLPEWLTAETAASKIDTDKLNPEVADAAEQNNIDKEPSSMATKILGNAEDEEADVDEEDLWMEESGSEPDWLSIAKARYTDDDDDDDAFTNTPDWLTAAPDEDEAQTGWLVEAEEDTPPTPPSEPLADTTQLTSSLLNDWLENTAHETDEDENWFAASADEQSAASVDEVDEEDDGEEEDDAAAWVDEQSEDLDWGMVVTEPEAADDEDDLELPDWIDDTEDSFALMDETADDEGLFPDDLFEFDDLQEETPPTSAEPEFVGQRAAAELDEIEFDFSFYENQETDETAAVEQDDAPEEGSEEIAFDVADFAFDALESDTAEEDINPNLDEILSRFSNLPATQVLSANTLEQVEPNNEEAEEDLFDFKFDRFELATNRKTDEKDLEDLVNRLATLPVTQPLQTASDNLIDPNFADEAESNVLLSLLTEIDAEMGVTYAEDMVVQTAQAAASTAQPAEQSTPFGMTKGQFVVFILGDMAYAFPLDQVEEIMQPPDIKDIPNVPRWVRGAAKINNSSVPVIDLRRFFGIRSHTKPSSKRVLVVHDAEEKVRAGLFVDEVKAVRSIPNGEISPLTNTAQIAPTIRPYTYGFYNKIILLDINRLFDSPDMAHIGLKTS